MKKGLSNRKNPPPPREVESSPSDDEEDEEMEGAFEDFSDEASEEGNVVEWLSVTQSYLKDPLKAYFSNPNTVLGPKLVKAIYGARGLIAKQIDPKLGPNGPFAEEFRAIERERLATMKEKLFLPRRALARQEVANITEEELQLDGTGLLWRTAMQVAAEATHGKSIPIEFTERDEEIFNHCIDVEPSFLDNDPFKGAQFTFFFAPNRFFSNKELRCTFHFPSAYLALDRIGVDVPFISAVTTDTPVQWIGKNQFEVTPEDAIKPKEIAYREALMEAYFGKSISTHVADDIKRLISQWPRSMFTMLFETNTGAEAKELLTSAIVNTTTESGAVVYDDFPGGPSTVKASSLEILPWLTLWRSLDTVVRAPMINALDHENDVLDGDDYEDDEEEEDDDDEEDASESDDSDVKHKSKQHRSEPAKKKAPASSDPDCKQQ